MESTNVYVISTNAVLVSQNDGLASEVPSANVPMMSVADARALSTVVFTNETEKASSSMSKLSAVALGKSSIMCRICHTDEALERLMSPCFCKGTHAFVHRECLEQWLRRSGLSHCELCRFRFATANQLRYGFWESMRIWFSHPRHRALLQSDLLLCMLLCIITFGMVAFSMFSMFYLTSSSSFHRSDTTRYWTETSIGVFLGIVYTFQLFAFVLNTIVVVKANILPWFRWWRRSREIQLLLRDNNANQNE